MSPIEWPTALQSLWLRRPATGLGRASILCLGLGLGTAFAADLATSPSFDGGSGPATDEQLSTSHWRLFDPGFLVDHLPFKLTVGQTISYNDNVSNLPDNFTSVLLPGRAARGDFYSDTTISVASRFPMGAEVFFFNGTYAPREYFTDTALNAQNYSINGGVDFNLADRCTGRLVAGLDQHQAALDETAGFGVNNTKSESFNETARCSLTGHITGLFNSGVSRSDNTGVAALANTALSFGLNNYTQHYVAAGLEYNLSGLDTLRGIATFTTRDFDNRASSSGLGLASETQQQDYIFSYQRTLSAKLDFSASGGISVFSNNTAGSGDSVEPVYSFQINYRPTRKIGATLAISKSVGAPQDVIADVQSSEVQSASVSYTFSPKININAAVSRSTTTNPTLSTLPTLAGGLPFVFGNSESKTASVVVNYNATPLMTATAGYTYTERTDTSRSNINAVSNIFRVGVVYTR